MMEQKDKDFDLQKVKEIIEEISRLMKEFGLAEVEIEDGNTRIVLKREVPILGQIISPIVPLIKTKDSDEKLEVIKSPTPGTFYGAISSGSKPYVEVGSRVTPQTMVCIIESMKVRNEIKAETTGTIVGILTKDGQAVEYGTPLFKVRPE